MQWVAVCAFKVGLRSANKQGGEKGGEAAVQHAVVVLIMSNRCTRVEPHNVDYRAKCADILFYYILDSVILRCP